MADSIGQPLNRVDGRLKVTGRARYTTEHPVPDLAHAVLVMSTIARGRITSIETRAASRVPGVLLVMTRENAPKLAKAGQSARPNPAARTLQLLQDDVVRYANQPIAVVVGDTLEVAQEGAALVQVGYAA